MNNTKSTYEEQIYKINVDHSKLQDDLHKKYKEERGKSQRNQEDEMEKLQQKVFDLQKIQAKYESEQSKNENLTKQVKVMKNQLSASKTENKILI